ncbi:MAG TPA: hypothetical protein VLJ80_00620 [Solirubrobacteraceae bacterium]|nr:hypothetical protein [Solirubrobacteraceae bacterium]
MIRQAGGPPRLPAGQRLLRFLDPTAAQLALPNGKHAIVESTLPMATQNGSGHLAPVDLGLTQRGGVFESERPVVGAILPAHIGEGVELPERGVSLTPADSGGEPLGGQGSLVGAAVIYPNTQTDADTIAKPIPEGVETSTILRSIDSPSELQYRVGLPSGARLVQSSGEAAARVVLDGQTIVALRPPAAADAEGTPVPVSMSAVGNLVTLSVASYGRDYRWPIVVDPELVEVDRGMGPKECRKPGESGPSTSNWCWFSNAEANFQHEWNTNLNGRGLGIAIKKPFGGSLTAGNYAGVGYHTQGTSKIFKLETETEGSNFKRSEARLELAQKRSTEAGSVEAASTIERSEGGLNGFWQNRWTTVTSAGTPENVAAIKVEALETNVETNIEAGVYQANVYIEQETSPEVTFNESEGTIDSGRSNVLYPSSSGAEWLSPTQGAFELKGKDKGLGIKEANVTIGSFHQSFPVALEGKCNGAQCPEELQPSFMTYNPSMPEGEPTIEWAAENWADWQECNAHFPACPNGKITRHIKIDAKKPSKLEVTGWPPSAEISAAPHTLTIAATDEAPSESHSSGVKAISVSIDGRAATTVPGAACTLGTCTATGSYTVNAENLTEGVHRLIETATDNAGNVASTEFTFDVRHASPVSVGPGSVDPTTGQLRLSATDVSLAGIGAVTRTYQSRNLTAGAEGPLGPQWALSSGGGEGITVLPTGSVVMAGPTGGRTTFVRKSNGEFESPLGDSSVKVESKEHVPGKGITEYVVSNAKAGTSTTFTQPEGTQNTAPIFANEFGSESTQLKAPLSDAVDSSGNVWVADTANNRLEKFSPAGVLLGAYGSLGTAGGQFNTPWGVAVNQSTGHVYVTDQGNFRVEEFTATGSFIKAIGWGVKDGKAEAETCESGCKVGLSGAGNSQFSWLAGLTLDSSGNLWIADYGNNRVQELTAAGGFVQKFGTEGTANGQFKGPLNIAFSGGKVYVTDYGNNRVQKFSTAGAYESKFGEAGTGNGKFSGPYAIAADPVSGNLLVVDSGNARVQVFSAEGTFRAKFGSSGSGPQQFSVPTGIALSQAGIYVVDHGISRVEEWSHPTWLPTISDGPLPSDTTTYTYEAAEVEEKTIIRPIEALAPPPAEVTCGTKPSELKKGCRALTFEYATSTTATGENSGEWNDYKGRLKKVYFHAYNPATKAMEEPAVAQYSYDKQGRLRAEWDPRISPALKTSYGYDSEGHVTALTPPGQVSWAFAYGTIAGDPNAGRLLKTTRAPASASLWNGEQPKNTETPKLTGTPTTGVALGVSHGTWSNSPVVYDYQWQDCNVKGEACVAIPGATNPNYKPTATDAGHTMAATVTAINGGGSVATTVVTSAVVKVAAAEYPLPAGSGPIALTTGPDGNVWVAESSTGKIAKISPSGTILAEYKVGTSLKPTGITKGPDGNLWFTDWIEGSSSKIGKITTAGVITEYTLPNNSHPEGIVTGPDGNLWYTDYSTNKVGKMTTAGSILGEYPLAAGSAPLYITTGPDHYGWFTEPGTNKIGKISENSQILKEYALPAGSQPIAIAPGPDGNLWFAERKSNKIGKITTGGTISEYSVGAGGGPTGITNGPDGNLWYTDITSSKVGKMTTSGTPTEYAIPAGSEPGAITTGPDGNLWYVDQKTSKVAEVPTTGTTPAEGEHFAPEAGTTLEYHLPVSGTGLPKLTKTDVETWGQRRDIPTEGMAVIPPDEPQGWPAASYKRATIDYLDELGRTVNIANPTGGISTTEYNEANEVIRSLSPDNRAAALKETGKTEEASEKLDTKTEYDPFLTQIVKVKGPQHLVKLASGAEVLARSVTRDYYDEGAPNGKTYNLLTRTTVGAEYEGKEADVRTTLKSYSGQNGLGWTLRQPTSTTIDPSGLALVTKTSYDENTGNIVETRSPGGNSETVYPPAFASAFASEGSANGQLSEPRGVATDASGNVWVADQNNNRIEKFSSTGTWLASYGSKGTGNLQFEEPWGIAINQATGNVYVADRRNNRIEELSSSGTWVVNFGTTGAGTLKEPTGVALDVSGNLYVSDKANNRVVEFGPTGTFIRAFGTLGSGNGQLSAPLGIAISEGSVYVVDSANSRVEQFSSNGTFIGQFGSNGAGAGQFKEAVGIAANPSSGVLYVADLSNARISEFSPAGRLLTEWGTWGPKHENSSPNNVAVAANGTVYDANLHSGQVLTWTPPEAGAAKLNYNSQFGSSGSGNGQFSSPKYTALDGEGNVWATDCGNNRIEKFSAKGAFIAAYGKAGSGEVQFNCPTGIDINQSTGNIYVSDSENHRIEQLSSSGAYVRSFGTSGSCTLSKPGGLKIETASGNVWVPDLSANKICEFSSSGTYIASYGSEGSGEVQFKKPVVIAFSGANLYVTDQLNHRVEELTNTGAYVRAWGIEGKGSGEFYAPEGIANDGAGNLYVVDDGAAHVEEFTSAGVYRGTFATGGSGEGQLNGPVGDMIDAAGNLYVVDNENNRIEKWSSVNQAVHYMKTFYYSAGPGEYECGEHAEWANLPCFSKPAVQPSDAPPSLPETKLTYNLWDEVEVKSEKLGSTERTTTQTYDAAGRARTSEEIATVGASLPKVTNEYSEATGELVKQSTSEGKSITSAFNKLGQLESYTDADSNTSKYTYDVDGRVEEVSDGKGSQIYVHDPTTGLLTEIFDSAAGKFKATYDPEGRLSTQSYPNGMTASYTHSSVGQTTQVEYVKTTHCSSGCTWFSDAIVPAIDGETRSQVSTLSSETYNYDAIGRLTKAQETPAGKGCTTRSYGYDEESNRTTLATSGPDAEGKCSEAGATSERHLFDEADRLIDPGTTYDSLGNATSLPGADAGGQPMTDTYYVDNQVRTQNQNEETVTYSYDPTGRTREAISTGKSSSTAISHYSGPGAALAWTSEGSETWTRNIPGIDGALVALQSSGGTPTLQVHDLEGNIVGTAALSETETKLLSTYNSTEFGVPQPGTTPPKYAWLGATGLSTEQAQASGTNTLGGASYVPQLARNLQTAPVVPPGAFPNGQGTGSPYGSEIPGWYIKLSEEQSAATLAEYVAAQEALAREAAEQASEEGGGEEGGGGGEGGGDPCSTAYEEKTASGGILGGEVAARADISYCWEPGQVLSVHWRYKRHRQDGGSILDISFEHWNDAAWWIGGHTSYEVETTAVFRFSTPCPPVGAPAVCGPWGKFWIHIWFTVNPDGSVESRAEFHKSLFS